MTFPQKLFVTGADTDIGKTIVASMLTIGLKAGYWKPVQSGREPYTDTEFVRQVTQLDEGFFYPEAYCLSEPLSPHAAAKIDNIKIDLERIQCPDFSQDHLIVEGAGGLLVPLNRTKYIIDLIATLDIPVLLVAKSGLGTLNHTLLSIEALRRRNLDLWGVVMNGSRHSSNEEAIRHYGNPKRLFTVEELSSIDPDHLKNEFQRAFGYLLPRSHGKTRNI